MPQLTWSKMMAEHPAGHLIVGHLPDAGAKGRTADRQAVYREELLGRLAAALKPAGAWAVTSIKEADGLAHAHLVFERKQDADRFAAAVQATPMGRYPGWASQRSFRLDRKAQDRIGEALGELG